MDHSGSRPSSSKINVEDLPASERAKIAALLKKDKSQNDIDWMYNQSKDDSKAYLLGKPVSDAEHVEKLGRDYEESASQRLARIDMETKYREDPLTVMKQRETEKRMELLKNTAKIKKLRRLLTMQKHKQERGRKHKKAKKRHRRSRSRSRSRSKSSSSSSGDELLDKFIKIIRQSDGKESVGGETKAAHSDDRSPEKEVSKPKHRPKPHYQSRSEQSSSHRYHDSKSDDRPRLSKEEIEARRAQMMQDAKEYQQVRSVRTNRHLAEKAAEESREAENRRRHGASFISDLKIEHTQRTSVEDGVHRKASRRQKDDGSSHLLSR